MADSRLTRLTVSLACALACGSRAERAMLRSCSALRHAQVGEDHARILLERQLDGVAQGEFEGSGLLCESAYGERQ